MTDIERAKYNLEGQSLSLAKGKIIYLGRGKNVTPILDLIEEDCNFDGFSVADLVVGRAAALLFAKMGVKEVYAEVMSKAGRTVLSKYGIEYSYGKLVDKLLNKDGTDVCPFEKAVEKADDLAEVPELLYAVLKRFKLIKKGIIKED